MVHLRDSFECSLIHFGLVAVPHWNNLENSKCPITKIRRIEKLTRENYVFLRYKEFDGPLEEAFANYSAIHPLHKSFLSLS